MIGGRLPVEPPAVAQQKMGLLDVSRMVAEDASRSVSSRLSNLPRDAQVRDQLEAERNRHAHRHRQIAGLLSKINEFLMRLHPSTVLEVVPAAEITLQEGQTWVDAIDATRRDVAALQGQRSVIASAPLPMTDQLKCVEQYVEKIGRQARPAVSVLQNGTLRVGFRDVFVEPEQVLALLAWIDPQKVRDALTHELESKPRVTGAMSASERLERMAEIEAQLLQAERIEESLIERAAKAGFDILRRVDHDPRAVLGVIVKAKAKAQPQAAQVVA
jgi:hypothetical protein